MNNIKRYSKTVFILCAMLTKRWFRDPVALFFTFMFPLLFLFVFGSLFRDTDVSFDVALINRSDTQFAAQFVEQTKENGVFKVKEGITSFDAAKDKMGRGEIDSIVELPSGFGAPDTAGAPSGKVVVYYEESNPQTGQTVGGIMQQELEATNRELTQSSPPLAVEQKSTETSNLTRFDYTFSGLIGFSIMSLAIFGMANGFLADKKTGALRRLRATPLKASQLILATALEYMLVGVLSIVAMFIVGILLFDFQMRGNYLTLAVFSLIGIFSLFGFGLAIGGWAKNENQSAPLSNLVAFPLMFLSGVFFPIFLMPEWLQTIATYLPLTPVIDGIRQITTENATLFDLGPELLIIAVWTIVIYFVATKVFRWE
ncbi:MAG: ABC transporter permease [Candidatus Saccharimonadales bacterium]